MFTLVTGGSGSGKSEYAEKLLEPCPKERKKYYIATMLPFGEEGKKRVEKHRNQRKNRNFLTVERYMNLKEIILDPQSDILLECMSNLVANEMFEISGHHEKTEEEIILGIEVLRKECHNLVVVTNEVSSDGIAYDHDTKEYIRVLNRLNQRLAQMADRVIEVVHSVPHQIK